ncbi:MAG: NADH-quinone oxidoreductase subunit L, partial [Acidobacteria bacterium]|nr:NADH-quinone oxidoreductase subunit L [Acidobacteriota bacterium]
MLELLYLIPVLPLAGAAVNGVLGKRFSRRLISVISCGLVALCFLIALGCFWELLRLPPGERHFVQTLYVWISAGAFESRFAYLLDPLSMIMILVVTGVGLLIHVYAVGYMWEDAGFYRFFAYLNLFMFS